METKWTQNWNKHGGKHEDNMSTFTRTNLDKCETTWRFNGDIMQTCWRQIGNTHGDKTWRQTWRQQWR